MRQWRVAARKWAANRYCDTSEIPASWHPYAVHNFFYYYLLSVKNIKCSKNGNETNNFTLVSVWIGKCGHRLHVRERLQRDDNGTVFLYDIPRRALQTNRRNHFATNTLIKYALTLFISRHRHSCSQQRRYTIQWACAGHTYAASRGEKLTANKMTKKKKKQHI